MTLKKAMAHFERQYITRILNDCAGNRRAAAKALGISIATLYRRMADLKIGYSEPPTKEANKWRASFLYVREWSNEEGISYQSALTQTHRVLREEPHVIKFKRLEAIDA